MNHPVRARLVEDWYDDLMNPFRDDVDNDCEDWEKDFDGECPDYETAAEMDELTAEKASEVAPPGWSGTTKKMKQHKDIDNPFALCLSGDTQIPCLDGLCRSVRDIAESGEDVWLYSLDGTGLVVPGLARARFSGVKPLVAITLDNSQVIRCSPEHRWVRRDGAFVEAASLSPGDSLMPFKRFTQGRKKKHLHEQVYHPGLGTYSFTHWAVMRVIGPQASSSDYLIHHVNDNALDNKPDNLEWKTKLDHLRHHAPKAVAAMHKAMVETYWTDPEFRRRHAEAAKRNTQKWWDSLSPEQKEAQVAPLRARAREAGAKAAPIHKARFAAQTHCRQGHPLSGDNLYIVPKDKSRGCRECRRKANRERMRRVRTAAQNHRIVSVDRLGEIMPVYDVAVDGWHTFAVEAGVFSHNSWWMHNRGDSPHIKPEKKAREAQAIVVTQARFVEAMPASAGMSLLRTGVTTLPDVPVQSFRDDLQRKISLRRVMVPHDDEQADDGAVQGESRLPQTDPRVNYRYASNKSRSCGACENFQPPGGCAKVTGAIRRVDTCSLWSPNPQPRTAQAVFADRVDQNDGADG